MGMGSWDKQSVRSYAAYSDVAMTTTSHRELFKAREVREALNVHDVSLRESCDSEINPESNAIIIGLDITGSMGSIAHAIAKEGLGVLMTEIMERQPVTNPHIMFMGIGDACAYDRAPLQASQFEPDIRIVEQLNDLYVEGGGGGNDTESYDLPWYFAATRTSIDCMKKRNTPGYLFTMGDELAPAGLKLSEVEKVFGANQIDMRLFDRKEIPSGGKLTSESILEMAQESYHVFHLVIEQGSYARHYGQKVINSWRDLLGKRAILVDNYDYVSQVILSIMEVSEGGDPETVAQSWEDPKIISTVTKALGL